MPLFDYLCSSCGHEIIDVLQLKDTATLTFCPECCEPTLGKMPGAPNFHLKGEGFYKSSPTKPEDESTE